MNAICSSSTRRLLRCCCGKRKADIIDSQSTTTSSVTRRPSLIRGRGRLQPIQPPVVAFSATGGTEEILSFRPVSTISQRHTPRTRPPYGCNFGLLVQPVQQHEDCATSNHRRQNHRVLQVPKGGYKA